MEKCTQKYVLTQQTMVSRDACPTPLGLTQLIRKFLLEYSKVCICVLCISIHVHMSEYMLSLLLLLSLSLPSLLFPLTQSSPTSSQLANDTARKNKSLAQQVKEINRLYEDEQHNREEQHQLATKTEKRANELALEVEEICAQMEQVCEGVRV